MRISFGKLFTGLGYTVICLSATEKHSHSKLYYRISLVLPYPVVGYPKWHYYAPNVVSSFPTTVTHVIQPTADLETKMVLALDHRTNSLE